jgi:hypothetical protein
MRPPSAEKLAYSFIRKAGRPVPMSEVIDYVLSVRKYGGKTPRNTVSSLIQKSGRIRRKNGCCLPISLE